LVGAGYVYLPYLGWSDSHADAQARVEAYLAAVAGGNDDRGWNLLEASGQAAYGEESDYRRAMAGSDWSRFRWDLLYNGVCDDGLCSFVLHLDNGPTSAPAVLWSDGSGDPGVLRSTQDAPVQGEAFIEVRQRGWFGGIGIEVFGARAAGP
jgi:hypothetical protein